MALRTFYWQKRKVSTYKYYKYKFRYPERLVFKHGNAGDIFNIDLIKYLYGVNPSNVKDEGKRLLMVGSIMNEVKHGDIINGIGWKGNDIAFDSDLIASLTINGVRGPLTKTLFEKHNADLSNLKFEYDPGLLIKEVYNLDLNKKSEKQVVFLPHYRDANVYKGKYPKQFKIINIDNKPDVIAKEFLKSKVIYTSSLHGIIFAHALEKPCVFVKPQSDEPLFKYRDYFLSIDLELPEGLKDIHSSNFLLDKPTVKTKNVGIDDFYFPSLDSLKNTGYLEE
ncbi:polysaccharide pyruvyl transferase family protein [Psychroserpens mesophilus]|uniref:polysaccharide pyruvyl transferase family protein n=1 Tax=Psychroserpens mesophilus TaxID=325473 RepID=UPI0005912404|nr:polysaccharide pyruvyl transferase family protein [Psychroserpens mesophilus]